SEAELIGYQMERQDAAFLLYGIVAQVQDGKRIGVAHLTLDEPNPAAPPSEAEIEPLLPANNAAFRQMAAELATQVVRPKSLWFLTPEATVTPSATPVG